MKMQILLTALFFLSSCANDVVRINDVEVSTPNRFLLVPIDDKRPQLSFCWTKASIGNPFKDRNASVQSDEYYLNNILPLVKKDNPFTSIEFTEDSTRSDCDVVLNSRISIYVSPMGSAEYTISATAVGKEIPTEQIWVYVPDKDNFEEAAFLTGRYLFNSFAPGTEPYNKLISKQTLKKNSFEEEAKKYRELKIKPELSEEAVKFKVQAAAAFGRKDFVMADTRYNDALKIAPWWPEGHFNRALLLAELGRYHEAMAEMNKYLLLVPDAPDAKQAHYKIYEWEDLAKDKGGQVPNGDSRHPESIPEPCNVKPCSARG